MEPEVQVFYVPKFGNSEEEYEDAAAYQAPTRRFAVADGATESSFADAWARSLVRQYTVQPPLTPPNGTPLHEWVIPLQREWHASIKWDKLPWFAEEKARSGAFAAFLGLHFVGGTAAVVRPSFFGRLLRRKPSAGTLRWHALAVGDSCLFHVRADRLLKAFPLDSSKSFNDRPLLISSNPARNQSVWRAVQLAQGDCRSGDWFLLATDALSKWFLSQYEAGGKPWQTLRELRSSADFTASVDKLRAEGSLKNDDTTLLMINWTGVQTAEVPQKISIP